MTDAQHIQDRYAASGPNCRRGHPWSVNAKFNYLGYRSCLACTALRATARKQDPAIYVGTCSAGHPWTAENTRIGTQGARYCLTCRRPRNARPRPVTPAKLRLIFERLHEGQTLNALFGQHGKRYVRGSCVTNREDLFQFMTLHPDVGKKIRSLADKNRAVVRRMVGDMNRKRAAPAILRNNGADAYAAIIQATARLWEGERGDVMSLMFLAAAEGRLDPRDAVRRLPEFVKQHRQQFGRFRPEGLAPDSLDRPLFDDGTTILRDTITAGLWQ